MNYTMTEMEELKKEIGKLHTLIVDRALQDEQNRLADEKWKDDTSAKLDPLVAIYLNLQTFGKVYEWTVKHFFHLVVAVGGIAGAILALRELFKKP